MVDGLLAASFAVMVAFHDFEMIVYNALAVCLLIIWLIFAAHLRSAALSEPLPAPIVALLAYDCNVYLTAPVAAKRRRLGLGIRNMLGLGDLASPYHANWDHPVRFQERIMRAFNVFLA